MAAKFLLQELERTAVLGFKCALLCIAGAELIVAEKGR
jgi:hypothetical protein